MHASCRRRSNGRGSLHASGSRASRPDGTHRTKFPRCASCRQAPGPRPQGLCRQRSGRTGVASPNGSSLRRVSRAHASPCVPRRGSTLGARPRPTARPSARRYVGTGAARPGAGWRDPASRAWRRPKFTGRQQLLTHNYHGRRVPRTRRLPQPAVTGGLGRAHHSFQPGCGAPTDARHRTAGRSRGPSALGPVVLVRHPSA